MKYSISRPLRLALTIAGMVTLLGAAGAGAQSDHCGDVNGDGNVTTVDSLTVLRGAVGVPVTYNCPAAIVAGASSAAVTVEPGGCGDVNGDGNSTTVDALMILNYSVGVPVEFQCASGPSSRNLVRYFNALVCQQKVFTSTVEVLPSGKKWTSTSGEYSEYKPWDEPSIGDTFEVSTGPCGSETFVGTIALPEGNLILMRLELGGLFNLPRLRFIDEGPINASRRDPGRTIGIWSRTATSDPLAAEGLQFDGVLVPAD
jgi:hypothetical protein